MNDQNPTVDTTDLEKLKKRVAALESSMYKRQFIVPDFLKSKKAWAAIIGTIGGVLALFGIDGLSETQLAAALSPLVAYIIGQGIADTGKEKAKIEQQGTT